MRVGLRGLLFVLAACVALVAAASAAGRMLTPVSTVLAYSSAWDIWVIDYSRGIARRLTHDDSRALDDAPSWSPDGAQIVFMTVRSIPFGATIPNGEIAVMNVRGSGFRLLTRLRAWDDAPAWSPDGRSIAFRSNRDADSGTAVYVIDLDDAPGAEPRMVIADPLRSDFAPAWSPDGSHIIVHVTTEGRMHVVSVDALTGATETLLARAAYQPQLSPDGVSLAVWLPAVEGYALAVGPVGETPRGMSDAHLSPAPFAWSPDGATIAYASTENALSVVKLVDLASGETSIAFVAPARVSGIAWRP